MHAWYPITLTIGLAIICGLLVHLWSLRSLALARWLMLAFAIAALQTLALVAEILSPSVASKSAWMFLRFAVVPWMTVAWMAIALQIAGWWSRRWLLLVVAAAAIGGISTVCAVVPGWQALLRDGIGLSGEPGWQYLVWRPGPWVPVHLAVCYGAMALAVGVLLVRGLRPGRAPVRTACLGSAALILAPLIADAAFMIGGYNVVPGFNLAPVVYIATHAGFIALIGRGHLVPFGILARTAAVASLPQPIFALDPSGKVVDRNPAAGRLGRDPPHELCAEPAPAEWTGGGRTWLVSTSPILLRRRTVGRLVMLTDVSDLRAALGRAEEADQAKARFLAVMSHELRTPLNSVVGYARLLERGHHDERTRESLRAITTAGNHLTRLVGDLFDLARIDAGRHELHPEPVAPRELLERLVEDHRPVAEARGLRLDLVVEGPAAEPCLLDPVRLTQVVGNLLRNAITHTVEGSVCLTISVDGDVLVVAVSDTGCGMSPEDQGRLFRPFAQRLAERRSDGLGLGLAICHGWVTAMRGTIACISSPGSGSTFTVRLPRVRPAPEALAANDVRPPGRRLRVLVADDDDACRRLLGSYLADLGHEAVQVGDGAVALACLSRERFDLALLDEAMPGCSGRSIAAGLLAAGGRRPVLAVVTAAALAGDRERLLAAGFDAYVPKPVDLDAIDRILAGLDQGR